MTRTGGGSRTAGTRANRTSTVRTRGSRVRMRSAASFVAKMVMAGLFALIVVAGLTYVRLMHSPVALNFLASTFASGIADEFSGTGVSIESVALRLNDNGLLQFELGNVRITDASGEPLIMAPTAAVSLSRRAMVRGQIAIESLDLVSARLTLFYSEEGTLSLKFSSAQQGAAASSPALRGAVDTAQPAAGAPADADWTLGRIDLVKAISEASARARRREHASAYLREIGLRSATVVVDDGARKSICAYRNFDLDLDPPAQPQLVRPPVPELSWAGCAGPRRMELATSRGTCREDCRRRCAGHCGPALARGDADGGSTAPTSNCPTLNAAVRRLRHPVLNWVTAPGTLPQHCPRRTRGGRQDCIST